MDVQSTESLTGEKNTVVRLCVAVKRKLQLYYWKGKKFEEFKDFELTVPDIPRQLSWYNIYMYMYMLEDNILL